MSRIPSSRSFTRTLAVVALAAMTAYADASADDGYHLRAGEINEGDLYLFSGDVRIDGELDGDLWVFGRTLEINGIVDGKVRAWTQRLTIGGEVRDSAQLFAQTVRVSGTVNGDLMTFGQSVAIAPDAHITGNLKTGGADVTIEGKIDGDVEATGGQIDLRGSVGGNVELEAEAMTIDPEARIDGDLVYVSRKELDLDPETTIGGSIDWDPSGEMVKDDDDRGDSRFARMLIALLVGLAAVAIFPRQAPAIVARVGGDGLRSAGVGFIAAVVVPVAGLLACVLIITIPLVFIAMLGFVLLVYLAKIPVAIWIGQAILGRLGRGGKSPYLALLVGIPVLYVIFMIPYIGSLAWFACLFTGLGAIVLYISDQRQQRRSPDSGVPIQTSTPPPAGTGPSPTPQPS